MKFITALSFKGEVKQLTKASVLGFQQAERPANPTEEKTQRNQSAKQSTRADSPPLAAEPWAHAHSFLPQPLICQLRRHQLGNQTLGAHRCSSTWIIPSQIMIPCALALHLSFQSRLITYIISSPNCLQSTRQLNKTETLATAANCKVHISVPNNSLCFPLQLAFQRAFKGSIT